jgi:hypothetical protein
VNQAQEDNCLKVILSMTTKELVKQNHFRLATVLSKALVTDFFESILFFCENNLPSDKDWAKAQK